MKNLLDFVFVATPIVYRQRDVKTITHWFEQYTLHPTAGWMEGIKQKRSRI